MSFERILKTISNFVATVVVFFLLGGVYLSSKGFVWQEDGKIVLVANAIAQDDVSKIDTPEIPDNMVLPLRHVEGDENAKITIYEYSSLGCSHCADFHLNVIPELIKYYADKGGLRVAYVPFPLDKQSMDAALLAECMPKDKYFEFVNVLYKKQRDWRLSRNPEKVLKKYAALNGLDKEKMDECLHNDNNAREILDDRQTGITQLGIKGTPSFIISYAGRNEVIYGVRSVKEIEELITKQVNEY